jgi:mannose-1-phosphate guanylyltransferase
MHCGSDHQHHWGVILAGGEGVRLKSLTRFVSGEDTPKQFCRLLGGKSLLAQTTQRISRTICSGHTVYVLLNSHERFYSKELRNVPPAHMVVQPCNRGTLPAILSSLIHIIRQDKNAVVGFFPSDHHYTEEGRFVSGVGLAFNAAESNPETVILLGVAANHAETEYGWIEAAPAMSTESRDGLLKVKRFWEKPSTRTAKELLERGCVWNTFVMIGRAQAFLDLIRAGAAHIYQAFERLLGLPESVSTNDRLNAIYQCVATADFSKLVLSGAADRLGVWCLGDVGWSDLGDPRRVMTVLDETGITNEWMNSWRTRALAVAAGQ